MGQFLVALPAWRYAGSMALVTTLFGTALLRGFPFGRVFTVPGGRTRPTYGDDRHVFSAEFLST